MKIIKLTQGYEAVIDDEDYDSVSRFSWSIAKIGKHFYAQRGYYQKPYQKKQFLHRFIMGVSDSSVCVDHVDRNGLNNQKSNLRTCSKKLNGFNRGKNNGVFTSKYKGVYLNKKNGRFVSEIRDGDKKIWIGSFLNEKEAAIAYNKKAIKIAGNFSYLNIID